MTTKEKIIYKSIKKITKRLDRIKFIFESKPLTEICQNRRLFSEMLEKNKTIEQRTSKSFIDKLEELSAREDFLFKLADEGKDSNSLIDEQVRLESELSDLQSELYYMQRGRLY